MKGYAIFIEVADKDIEKFEEWLNNDNRVQMYYEAEGQKESDSLLWSFKNEI